MMILVVGPLLEEKYGSSNMLFVILATALVTGIVNFIFFLNDVIAIVNATAWHATDAQAAPLTPIDGIGTNIKFNINLTSTPAT